MQLQCPLPSAAPDDATFAAALAAILWRCATHVTPAAPAATSGARSIVLASYAGEVGGALATDEFEAASAEAVAARLPVSPEVDQ